MANIPHNYIILNIQVKKLLKSNKKNTLLKKNTEQ